MSKKIVRTGYFDDENCEYVIEDMYPVRPLLNYLWSEQVVCDCNQFGFGSSLAGIGAYRRAMEGGERLVFLKDNETGEVYSPNRNYHALPMEEYRCHVGQGYQKIVSLYDGVRVTFTVLVPAEGYATLFHVEVQETAGIVRDKTLYFALRPCANLTGHTSYGYADKEETYGGIVYPHVAYKSPTEYSYLYFQSERKYASYATCFKDFVGTYGSWSDPEGIEAKRLPSRGTTFENVYVAAVAIPCKLKPGQKKSFTFAMTTGKSMEECAKLATDLAKTSVFKAELKKQKRVNASYRSVFKAKVPNKLTQSLVNIWLKRQLSLGKTWGRVYGKGFRDVMQDIAAFVSFDVPLARKRIIYALEHQYANGNTIRMFDPDYKAPYNDGAAWIPACLSAYLKESGDFSLLDEKVAYLDGGEGTVLEHLTRGVEYLLGDTGKHGLVLLRGGDWNDSLNGAGNNGVGEGIWLSLATVKAAKECAEILGRIGKRNEEKTMLDRAEILTKNILTHGLTEGYFAYGYDDWGDIIGGASCQEASFYLNPQTWSVLAGVGGSELNNQVMDEVEARLKCDFGYTLCDPPYFHGTDHIGRVSYFMPGLVENAAVYVHGVLFKIAADYKLGRADIAYKTLQAVTYDNPVVQKAGVEPYAVTNMFIGPSNPYLRGHAPMSWITGSAGWMYRSMSEGLLGVQAEFDGLRIRPQLPTEWKQATMERLYRGVRYRIECVRTGKYALFVNGEKVEGEIAPYLAGEKLVRVRVEIE